jgi:hypothetical protein
MVLFHRDGQHGALKNDPVKVWRYTLHNEGSGKWRFAPEREIEFTSADASHVKFGAKIALAVD